MRSLCEAYQLRIIIRNKLRETNLVTAFENLDHSIDSIEDGYPAWHPAPLSFRAMVFSFVFVEITGDSYADFSRRLTRQPEVATILGFSRVPDESAFSRAWRNRFDNAVHEYIRCRPLRHQVSSIATFPAPGVRPKSDNDTECRNSVAIESTFRRRPGQRASRVIQPGLFDAGRASNALVNVTCFRRTPTRPGLVRCGIRRRTAFSGRGSSELTVRWRHPPSHCRQRRLFGGFR